MFKNNQEIEQLKNMQQYLQKDFKIQLDLQDTQKQLNLISTSQQCGKKFFTCILSNIIFFNRHDIIHQKQQLYQYFVRLLIIFNKSRIWRAIYKLYQKKLYNHILKIQQYVHTTINIINKHLHLQQPSIFQESFDISVIQQNQYSNHFAYSFNHNNSNQTNVMTLSNFMNIPTQVQDYLRQKNCKSVLSDYDAKYRNKNPKYTKISQQNSIFKCSCEYQIGGKDNIFFPFPYKFIGYGKGGNTGQAEKKAAEQVLRQIFTKSKKSFQSFANKMN